MGWLEYPHKRDAYLTNYSLLFIQQQICYDLIPTSPKASEARFLRALTNYLLLDGWDQVPYRDPGESTVGPSRVRKGTEALDYLLVKSMLLRLPYQQVLPEKQIKLRLRCC